jgi:hypothetical protein
MSRVIALLAAFLVAGCSQLSSWAPDMPKMDFGGAPAQASVRVESEPSGAEARSGSSGCRTPCMLPVNANGTSSISFAMNGYLPQTVAVQATSGGNTFDNPMYSESGTATNNVVIDPNPVYAVLQPEPTPQPQRRRSSPPPRRQSAAPPQQQPQQAQAQQPGFAPQAGGFR